MRLLLLVVMVLFSESLLGNNKPDEPNDEACHSYFGEGKIVYSRDETSGINEIFYMLSGHYFFFRYADGWEQEFFEVLAQQKIRLSY